MRSIKIPADVYLQIEMLRLMLLKRNITTNKSLLLTTAVNLLFKKLEYVEEAKDGNAS